MTRYLLRMTTGLYAIERAAIEAIIRQYPTLAAALTDQLEGAQVTSRNNTGAGFYTGLRVADDAPLAITASPIGEPFANVVGLAHGMGFFAHGSKRKNGMSGRLLV